MRRCSTVSPTSRVARECAASRSRSRSSGSAGTRSCSSPTCTSARPWSASSSPAWSTRSTSSRRTWCVLRNEHVAIGDAFLLAGVDDATAGQDVPRAVRGHDPALPLVLLGHHPRTIARAMAAGVDLQLSGHTHGGQLLPLGWLSRLFEPLVAGLASFDQT